MLRFRRHIITLAFLLGCLACKKTAEVPEGEYYNEFRTWLQKNGDIFSGEEIRLSNQANDKFSGKLDWRQSRKIDKNGEQLLVVPFIFKNSAYKNRKVVNDVLVGEKPSTYNMVFRKKSDHSIEAVLRISSFGNDEANEREIVYKAYDLKGQQVEEVLFDSQEKYRVLQLANAGMRMNSCQETITTSRYVVCEGGMDNTVCTFYTRTTYRYRCEYIPGQQEPPVWWIEDGSGYFEYEEHEQVYENQSIIDSLQGYPCAQEILTQITNCTNKVDSILIAIFGVNEDVNLKFKVNLTLSKDSMDGYTQFGGGSASIFNQTIHLNPWVLQNSTKEYIAVTYIHEGIHSIIDYWRNQLLTHQIDSNTFKSMFPIFWEHKRMRNSGEQAQHNEIAANYINVMKDFLISFNPAISNEMAEALAWGGLRETTAWQNRNDTLGILNKNHLARLDIQDTTSYQNYQIRKCD